MIRTPIGKIYGDILLARCGICDRFAHKGRRVMVDGMVYPSIKTAASSIGGSYSHLRNALERGQTRYSGHEVRYCED